MTKRTTFALIASLSLPLLAQDEAAPAEAPAMEPAEVKENSSYAFGYQTGVQFSRQVGGGGLSADDLSAETFTKGFMDAFKGDDLAIDEDKLTAAMESLRATIEEREAKLGEENKAAGEKFLAENKDKEGIETTESGLQYKVITKGDGKKLSELDQEIQDNPEFMITYKGELIDGTEFDASPGEEPIAVSLEVIPGFAEALKLMPVGSEYKVFIPSDLAYGAERAGQFIKPNSVLIFDLKVVEIKKAAPQQPFQFPGMEQMQGQEEGDAEAPAEEQSEPAEEQEAAE